jgi:hypothetical protein
MKPKLIIVLLLVGILAAACGGGFQKWEAQDAIDAFHEAGLESENERPLTKDDYGLAPFVGEGIRFELPSLCDDCGGRVFSFENEEDRDAIAGYYESLGESSALFFSWVFVHDNVVVQINGDLPEEQAREYETALTGLE